MEETVVEETVEGTVVTVEETVEGTVVTGTVVTGTVVEPEVDVEYRDAVVLEDDGAKLVDRGVDGDVVVINGPKCPKVRKKR